MKPIRHVPRSMEDPGSGILTDHRSWVGVLIQDPVDLGSYPHNFLRDPVDLGSCF